MVSQDSEMRYFHSICAIEQVQNSELSITRRGCPLYVAIRVADTAMSLISNARKTRT